MLDQSLSLNFRITSNIAICGSGLKDDPLELIISLKNRSAFQMTVLPIIRERNEAFVCVLKKKPV